MTHTNLQRLCAQKYYYATSTQNHVNNQYLAPVTTMGCSRTDLKNLFEGVYKFSINFEEILSLTSGNFEEHDKVLKSSTIYY